MTHEATIALSRPLLGIVLADPEALLPLGPDTAAGLDSSSPRPQTQAKSSQDDGLQEECQAIEQVLTRLNDISGRLEMREGQLLFEMQQAAVELAVAVASQLIHVKIQSGDWPVESLVREAVQRLRAISPITVRLHPEDIALLRRRLGKQPLCDEATKIRLVGDASLTRGDCAAETVDVSVLFQLDNQLAGMRQQLLESLTGAQDERRKDQPGNRSLRRFPDRRQIG